MPLFSLGLHRAVVNVRSKLKEGEKLFAFLDDVCVIVTPLRVLDVFRLLERELHEKACISVHQGKTQIWKRGGCEPTGASSLTAAARKEKSGVVVWRGDPKLPLNEQSLTVLGTPVGQPGVIVARLAEKGVEHDRLMEMILHVQDVQAAWLLLLFCAGARANFLFRTVRPELTREFASHHDEQLVQCVQRALQIGPVPLNAKIAASMLLTLGGMGLGSGSRIRDAAKWGSWADCLEMIQNRHPDVARIVVQGLASRASECLETVENAVERLRRVGVDIPSWQVLSAGFRPPLKRTGATQRARPDRTPTWLPERGVQQVHTQHRDEVVWPVFNAGEKESVNSQNGPFASVPFTSFPVCRVTRVKRLRLPLLLSVHSHSCGRLLDVFGHQRATCGKAGAQQARIFYGECDRADLQRSRCQGVHPRYGQELWTSLTVVPMQGGSRSWRKGCPSSEECNWRWMQHWCPPTTTTAHH